MYFRMCRYAFYCIMFIFCTNPPKTLIYIPFREEIQCTYIETFKLLHISIGMNVNLIVVVKAHMQRGQLHNPYSSHNKNIHRTRAEQLWATAEPFSVLKTIFCMRKSTNGYPRAPFPVKQLFRRAT